MRIFPILLSILLASVFCSAYAQPLPKLSEQFKPYPVIETPEAREFVRQGLAYAVELYGQPAIPVTTVILRYRLSWPFTNLTDPKEGFFTIFLSRLPREYAFYGQLAHELAHLLNAKMSDAYVEGLNTVFAERLLRRNGMDWSGWEAWYESGNDPFYSATYAMMKDIANIAGDDAMRDMLQHAKRLPSDPARMYIEIDEWLARMAAEKRGLVRAAILLHAPRVQPLVRTSSASHSFVLPR